MKKLLNKLKKQPAGPRSLAEIQQEFQQLSSQASNMQYQIYAHGINLKNVNERLAQVHKEADDRQKLDAEVKKELDAKKQQVPDDPVAINPGDQTSGAV